MSYHHRVIDRETVDQIVVYGPAGVTTGETRLQAARELHRERPWWTLEQIARQVGVSPRTIQRLASREKWSS